MTPHSYWNAGEPRSAASERTVIEVLHKACHRDPDRPAMIFEGGPEVSRRELLDRSERFAGYLRDRIKPDDRVALMLDNRAEFFVVLFAVIANRAMLVSINPSAREHDARYILQDSRSSLVIAGRDNARLLEGLKPVCPDLTELLYVDGTEPAGLDVFGDGRGGLDFARAECRPDDIVTVYYTSGTTGPPKGCMLDHEFWLRVLDLDLRMNPRGRERPLICLPFYYADPALVLLQALHVGGTAIIMRRFSVSRFWNVVRGHGVTQLLAIGSIPDLLLKNSPTPAERDHAVQFAISVGVPPARHRDLVERFGFPWLDNYGATESGLMARVPLDRAAEMVGSGSMGVPCPEVEIRIVDENGEGVAVGTLGEVLVRGPGMFRGYLNRPDATAEAMRGGWYHTGDLARADERGFLYFAGRKKDIIRRSGENLTASEVEAVLRQHPKILDAAVIAVPDELRGEEVKAYILPAEGETIETVPPRAVIAFCAERLAAYKVPRYLEYRTTDFPRTPSMRVQKDALRAEKAVLTDGCWDREKEMPGRL